MVELSSCEKDLVAPMSKIFTIWLLTGKKKKNLIPVQSET